MRRDVDAVVIGSGHNGLVAAAYLARAGWSVEVLEGNSEAGGAVATEELTVPGFRHDTFSSWHPLFHLSATYAELGEDLARRGLAYANADDVVAASVTPVRAPVFLHRDPARTAAQMKDRDGSRYLEDLDAFGRHATVIGDLLETELHSWRALRCGGRLALGLGRRDGPAFASQLLGSARGWLGGRFQGPQLGDLLSPWILHTGLTPDDSGGAFQLLALAGALHRVGLPVVRGGSVNFVAAFVRLIEDHGGRVRTGARVDRVLVEHGRAVGVGVGGEEVGARRAVVADVTPTQLYGELLPAGAAPARAVAQARAYRYNARSGAQIHLALSEPPRWPADARLGLAPIVHVTGGLDATSLACAEAQAGLLPAEPTIVCGQPTVFDPSRAPVGRAI
ncbi:MAG: phytoene desaturase family protein, partial [Acidimicrobiales bacterium]